MKGVRCKRCGRRQFVPDRMPEPYFCGACAKAYAEDQARDQELEQELEEEEAMRADDEARNIEAWQEEESKHQGEF